ncbi:transcription-repair coupling factor [Coriobacterium glomerans PW2]|uniref:Transcription-repair-coupling factor n=1 Tax=Coriobacterium glomerans (strain ATCC 49209 / DSM 20642 / JCM 10262 / PW2) TaxID=700015 RepID=F2N906_CORGP|nr:transcription-repair coupling factor [Coriobacterium glomerans]AEB07606.1 transcription-repair coupling factor [Coriobacterium glomerans PW2]
MLIHRIAAQLLSAEPIRLIEAALERGEDATLAVSQSARNLLIAAQFARRPRPTVYIVSGEEAADRAARALTAFVGLEHVVRYPERADWPWAATAADDAAVATRCEALGRMARGDAAIMVASARSLLRCVPEPESRYWEEKRFAVGDQFPFEQVPTLLVGMGYARAGAADVAGTFRVHGDAVDIFPAQSGSPVRIEFFGDEIDRIRLMVALTGQTIGEVQEVSIFPCRELALTDDAVRRLHAALYEASQGDSELASLLEQVKARIAVPELDRLLPLMYDRTVSPLEHVPPEALIALSEPRSLFDDCTRAYETIAQRAQDCGVRRLDGLYVRPKELDFGRQQRVNYVSLIRAGGGPTAELKIEQPSIAGTDTRFITRLRQLVARRDAIVFAIPDRGAREAIELSLNDESIPIEESLSAAPENADPIDVACLRRAADPINARRIEADAAAPTARTLTRGRVTFVDIPLTAGVVVPDAHLAVLSLSDLSARMDRRRGRARRRAHVTDITFPYQPGDYVVHATHGIGRFASIVRQEVGGLERDYFLLEYADGDKLYVPLEQVDRITRYVGPDGSSPRLTRLNTADWSRATVRARNSAKRLAFDLVDLYTRRSTVAGHAFAPDTPAQLEMEQAFPYEPTRDQIEAIGDIKADMEAPKPMDRLLCGDVGFGKTEVALRAAFKCVDNGYQVMVLCPTTILAQQHYETLFERFAPFDIEVEVLSRFRTPSELSAALAGFSDGSVDVLVGTHRLLSSDVNPHSLGLVIIDEEQRFGVQHKEQLKNLREQIDVLTLSATPIPRTMQMAMSGVRDMSLITTPPCGRRPVTVHVGEYDPDTVSAAIRFELAREGQVYYVSNRVKTIEDAIDRVHEAAPEARVGVAHGKMSSREVEETMIDFTAHRIDVLVATTIIESGIDNPHTNTLIIEDAQRLGLAQLYQLKGRVGRSASQAFAYFMFPGEQPLTQEATERLCALSEFQELGSGMRIAMRDLEIRGAGSLVGAEQHGNLSNVGFDLFTQMLGQAVAEARGEGASEMSESGVTINLPADFFLDEAYLRDVDRRVLLYRKLAAAADLRTVDEAQQECEADNGELPLAGRNLFDRARLRIRADRLGLESVSLAAGRLTFTGIDVRAPIAAALRERLGAIVYPKSRKLSVPYRIGAGAGSGRGRGIDAHDQPSAVAAALEIASQLGTTADED